MKVLQNLQIMVFILFKVGNLHGFVWFRSYPIFPVRYRLHFSNFFKFCYITLGLPYVMKYTYYYSSFKLTHTGHHHQTLDCFLLYFTLAPRFILSLEIYVKILKATLTILDPNFTLIIYGKIILINTSYYKQATLP